MASGDGNDLVQFPNVRIIRSTPPALFCRVGDRNVWLPREHISGKLWCTGDHGTLFIRRWIARDRRLIDHQGVTTAPRASLPGLSMRAHLHLVRAEPSVARAK